MKRTIRSFWVVMCVASISMSSGYYLQVSLICSANSLAAFIRLWRASSSLVNRLKMQYGGRYGRRLASAYGTLDIIPANLGYVSACTTVAKDV